MTSFPNSPRLQKGALIGLDPFNPLASIIVFQYNPDTMTRTVTVRAAGGDGDRGEALHLKSPPQENIRLDVEIDTTDQHIDAVSLRIASFEVCGAVKTRPMRFAIAHHILWF